MWNGNDEHWVGGLSIQMVLVTLLQGDRIIASTSLFSVLMRELGSGFP
jgi:hypothetical protein